MSKLYVKKILKEMTECKIIQVNKHLKKKAATNKIFYHPNYKIKFDLDKPKILSLYIKVTEKCNLKCNFCSQNCNISDDLTFSQAKIILDKAKKYSILYITYTGGEPLLNNDLLKIVQYGHTLGLIQTIVTNGTLLDNNADILQFIDKIGVSFHGNKQCYESITAVKNSFDKLNSALQKARGKTCIELNCTLCKENTNLEQIKFVANYALENNFRLSFARINYLGKSRFTDIQNMDEICQLITQLNKANNSNFGFSNCVADCLVADEHTHLCHGCGAGVYFISIDNHGNVTICPSSNLVVGNIFTQSFEHITHHLFKLEQKRIKSLPQSCLICKNLTKCKGGCKIETTDEYSSDKLVNQKLLNFKDAFLNSLVLLSYNKIVYHKGKIILPSPYRITSKKYVPFLKMLDGTRLGADVIKNFDNKGELLAFTYLLYQDKHLILRGADEKF